MSKLVYLAGPIDDTSSDHAKHWRAEASQVLGRYGIHAFNPYLAYNLVPRTMMGVAKQVLAVNETAIRVSDAVIVNLAVPGKGIGSIREMDLAVRLGLPVAAVTGDNHKRLALHDVNSFQSLADACEWLVKTLSMGTVSPDIDNQAAGVVRFVGGDGG